MKKNSKKKKNMTLTSQKIVTLQMQQDCMQEERNFLVIKMVQKYKVVQKHKTVEQKEKALQRKRKKQMQKVNNYGKYTI